jgi:S-(hydroxymethyl)glutathione dehydrogenase/alcohol dehydrogenase
VKTTRAAVLFAPGQPLELLDLEIASPGANEVLVRVVASGVCHSDLSVVNGSITTRLPAVLGHEGAGVVEAVGPGVTRVFPGDHVVLSWSPACEICEECVRGAPHLCAAAWPAMFAGSLLDGTSRLSRAGETIYHYSLISSFADLAVVSERSCVPIGKEVPFDIAALVGCAITTGMGAVWNTGGVRPGDRVAVIGAGGVGLSAVMAAAAAGASPVVAVDPSDKSLEAALEVGATGAVGWAGSAEATAEAIKEAVGGGVDFAIEAVGRPETALAAFLSTRGRGATVIVGIPAADETLNLPLVTIPRLERRILGSIYGSARPERDFRRILDLYLRGRLPLDRLVGRHLPVDAVNEAFRLLEADGGKRIVLSTGSETCGSRRD